MPSSVCGQQLSKQIANYTMNIALDVEDKTIAGETVLEFKNPSGDTIYDLQFHLYFNAFKNTRSTFMQSSDGFLDIDKSMDTECGWSYSEIIQFVDDKGKDLISNGQYISPDDNNEFDQTVWQVILDEAIAPFETQKFTFTWEAKIPKAKVRTGYNQDYYFFAQWFPKLGVYEPAGMRYAESGAWNCHQYHASGEYYGEFGNYDVTLRVPKNYQLAATGNLVKEEAIDEDKIYQFQIDDVIDFTWSTSPHFVKLDKQWRDVNIQLYTYPGHEHFADRYFTTSIQSLEYMDTYVGKYPYKTLSIIDPPIHGLFTGGMEYPTLISSLSFCFFPGGVKTPETLIVHEFVHQYFMQMVATHEQEEPWMDEGFTTYYEGRILDEYYGEKTSLIDTWGVEIGNKEFNRIGYWSMDNPKIADNSYKARDFVHGGYNSIAYNKTAMMLQTLEGILGLETLDRIMKIYFEKWKFDHPNGLDFIQVFKDNLSTDLLKSKKIDLDRFFEEALYGSLICDYRVAKISNFKTKADRGFLENNTDCVIVSKEGQDSIVNSEIVLHRIGEMILPVDVLITYGDGSETSYVWDGVERSHGFTSQGTSKIIKVELDPARKLSLERNFIDNALLLEKSNSYKKYTSKFKVGMQHFLDFLNFLS